MSSPQIHSSTILRKKIDMIRESTKDTPMPDFSNLPPLDKFDEVTTTEVRNRNRNRKLDISTAPTKAKSREPAYSQALNQNRIDRQGVKIQRVRQADSQTAKVDDA